jgi:uncharacterized membrane protein (Fun14 family)
MFRRLTIALKQKHVKTAAVLLLTFGPSITSFPHTFNDKETDKTLKEKLAENVKKASEQGTDFNAILAGLQDTLGKGVKDVFGDGNPEEMARNAVQDFFEKGYPGQIGYGFLMGYSSGYALKKVSKVVAFMVGGAFIMLQTMSYTGYLNVDYNKVQKDIENALDMNGDGVLDIKDGEMVYNKIMEVVGYQMPSGGGFGAGILMGLRG